MFVLDKFRDYSRGFCHCFCCTDINLSLERFLDFGYPCIGFDQRHGLYCGDFLGSIKKQPTV